MVGGLLVGRPIGVAIVAVLTLLGALCDVFFSLGVVISLGGPPLDATRPS